MATIATMLPNAPLEPATQEQLRDALMHAFPNQPELDDLLHYKWGFELGDELDPNRGRKYVYGDLVTFVEGEGKSRDLLALALSAKPNNPKLRMLGGQLLPDMPAATARYATQAAAVPAVRLPTTLEAVVTERSRLFDFGAFLERVTAIGPRLCRVAAGSAKGTGFLIGPCHVLTNYHVVEPVLDDPAKWPDVTCLFDYWRQPGSATEPPGTPVKLAADKGVVISSPYSDSDLSGTGAPGDDQLDFALLRLSECVGAQRGFFALPTKPTILAQHDVVMIPQHVLGQPLEVAYGAIVELPGSGLRYRYDVTTDNGSSGAPVFTADLDPIGLHHAADPDDGPSYNQGVPLWRVARALAQANIDLAV